MGRNRKHVPLFPAVDRVIQDKGGVRVFCAETYYPAGTYYAQQRGDRQVTLPDIMVILEYTGLTFGEAFMGKPVRPALIQELREKNIPARAGTTKPGKTRKEHP